MLFDWLAREGSIVLSWWALVTLAGAAVLPLCVRLFSGLPDRGYTLARAVGLLLVGFAFWLLASLGFLHNTPGNIILSWFIVLGVGLAVYFRGERFNWREWWRENSIVVIVGEVLFVVLLFSWAIFRAHQNNLTGTEKPMELAFMSAVQRSDVFPPNDPWMSGYAISYYYFGYVIEGMLASLSGIRSTVGFNMNIALLFSLTGLTTFGVVYNLVRSRAEFTLEGIRDRLPGQGMAALVGLLGAVFVILLGNFQAVLIEVPYQSQTASPGWLAFWDTQERDVYGGELPAPDAIDQNPLNVRDPQNWSFWWWFRASRIIQDRNLDGTPVGVQPIDEFPQFSFLLADNHPHVLALPFAMLALGLALNVLLTWRNPSRGEVIFYGLCLGGLVFLNTWDGPIYMVVLTAADGLRRLMRNPNGRLKLSDWLGLGVLAGSLVVVTLIFYLPFFISFRSQAGGVLPNLINPTQFRQYFIMFGPFVLILSAFIGVEAWRAGRRMNYGFGVLTALGVLLALLVVVTAFVIAATVSPQLRDGALRFIDEAGGLEAVLPALIQRRILYGVTSLVLLFGIALVVSRLFPALRWGRRKSKTADAEPETVITYPAATGFALLLMGVGLVLTLVPEFLYLRDNFGVRINTIFKFYYQTWLVFGVASAYGLYSILSDRGLRLPNPALRGVFASVAIVGIAIGLVYPALGLHNRMFIETGRANAEIQAPLTLDGGPSLTYASDYASIMCLRDLVGDEDDLVIAEAIGNAYNPNFGRVGALTGIPILLGWENHEGQWRGTTYGDVVGSRPQDIETLYTDLRWESAQGIIQTYGIDYVFYGNSERLTYGEAGEEKFRDSAEIVCERDGSAFYRVNSTVQVAAR